MNNYVCQHYKKFDDDCDDFFKKCRSLESDLKTFKVALIDDINSNNGVVPRNGTYFHVKGLKTEIPVFKVKKFRCQAIKKGNRSGFRLIFAYDPSVSLIYFIEFYYKKKENTNMNMKRAVNACDFICNQ